MVANRNRWINQYCQWGVGMYYSDLTCNPPDSLKKIENLGIVNSLPVDWMGIVTLTKKKKIFIRAEIDYHYVGGEKVQHLLEDNLEDMLVIEESTIYGFPAEGSGNVIVSLAKIQHDYKVFFVCCSIEGYTEKDLAVMKVIMNVLYENFLLNNEIIQERNYLQNVLDSTGSAVMSINLDGEITTANRASLNFFCMQDISGKKYYELFNSDEAKKIQQAIQYVSEYNTNYYVKEVILPQADHGFKAVNLSISPLYDGNNKIAGVVIIGTDVTKRKILESEVEQLKQFAALGEVASGVAHDIKNPLMSIRGCARILEKSLQDPKHIDFLKPIIQEVDRINEVVEQMISYGNLTQESNYAHININEVLTKSINVIHFHKKSKYIQIEKDLTRDLPLIRGNNVQLQQAFINILINSVQAIEKEGIIRISSSYLQEKELIRVVISDNGVGIDTQDLGKIFKPFYTTKSYGTGIGLSIVDRVIKKHGGEVAIKSQVNRGTCFEVSIPCWKEDRL